MNLDEELRATFAREAESRTAPPPDVVGMIGGGRARRRRRTMTRLGVAAAVTVLVGGAAYGVVQVDPSPSRTGPGPAGTPTPPAESATTPLPGGDRPRLEPGVPYRMAVGVDASGRLIEADVTVEGPNWEGGDFPMLSDRDRTTHVGVGVYQPLALAAGTGCVDGATTTAGTTVDELAAQLARLPRSRVLRAPTPTEVSGHAALHLRLRVDSDCPSYYRVADAIGGERGITYPGRDDVPLDVVIDLWVLDLDGAPVVVDQWRNEDAPEGLVDRAGAARESVTFVGRD